RRERHLESACRGAEATAFQHLRHGTIDSPRDRGVGCFTAAVEKLGITTKKAGLERIPTQPIELTEEQMAEVEVILEKIEEDDDVQVVFTNLA
ncbi:MAG: hypothetical protein EOP83_37490, partial [Verrucomicrobiaceae bacterium]